MKSPVFLHGVGVAAILAFFASAVVATLVPFLGFGTVLRLVIPAVGLAYILYLFSRSTARVGRITTVALWVVLAAGSWWLAPALPLYLLIHVGTIWLIRSLYFHSGVLPALMDLGLCALSICVAVWAIGRSGSIFLATWCFFLVQALFVVIPPALPRKAGALRSTPADDDGFARARRQADEALRQLFTR